MNQGQLDYIKILDEMIGVYHDSILEAGNKEAIKEFGRTDWYFDPARSDLQGTVVGRAIHTRKNEKNIYGIKGRNAVAFGNGGISVLRNKSSKTFSYPLGSPFSGRYHYGRDGILEIVSHEAGHTLSSNIYDPVTQKPFDNLEGRANGFVSSIKSSFPIWYQDGLYRD